MRIELGLPSKPEGLEGSEVAHFPGVRNFTLLLVQEVFLQLPRQVEHRGQALPVPLVVQGGQRRVQL